MLAEELALLRFAPCPRCDRETTGLFLHQPATPLTWEPWRLSPLLPVMLFVTPCGHQVERIDICYPPAPGADSGAVVATALSHQRLPHRLEPSGWEWDKSPFRGGRLEARYDHRRPEIVIDHEAYGVPV